MIKSMTGFGRKEAVHPSVTLVVEVRSVNHRFLDIVCRLPKGLAGIEERCKQIVQQHCQRGRIEITIASTGERQGARQVTVDRQLARQYTAALRTLQRDLRLRGQPDLALVAGLRDVVSLTDQPRLNGDLEPLVVKTLTAAVRELARRRAREGEALARAIRAHLDKLERAQAAVADRAPQVSQDALARMKARVQVLLETHTIDEGRLHQELAILTDRSDVSEELVRLTSHCTQFKAALNRPDAVGKTLDFYVQEMGREVNTIGSKANDASLTASVVQMKTELEKIREQVQNVE